MSQSRILKYIIGLMLIMFVVHRLGEHYDWYYAFWYYDIIMHFLGGLWVGLFFLYVIYHVLPRKVSLQKHSRVVLEVLIGVFVIGFLWEVFEYAMGSIARDSFSLDDTLADIFNDLVGGLVATMIYFRKFIPGSK